MPLRSCFSLEVALVAVGLVVLIMSSGITYGWTALEVVLKKEGVYESLSTPERNTKLSTIMTIAMVCVNVGGITFGALLDFAGPIVTNITAGSLFLLSCFIFGYRLSLIVGYGLMAFSGAGILAAGFRLGRVFPSHTAIVMTAVTCMFDSSTIVFMVFDGINQLTGMTIKTFFTVLALIMAVLYAIFVTLWVLYTRKQAAIEAELDRIEAEEEESLLAKEADKVEAQQRRFSDVSDFDTTFRPAKPNDAAVAPTADASQRLRRDSHASMHSFRSLTSARSALSHASRSSTGSRRSRMSRSNIMLVEEALALPPEDRQFNEVVGVNDDEFTLNGGTLNAGVGYGSLDLSRGGTKFAQTLLEDALMNPQVAAAIEVGGDGGTGAAGGDALLTASLLKPAGMKLIDKDFCPQVASKEWRFLIIMAIITIYRTQWYMTATQTYLQSIGDDHNTYAQITGMILPFEAAFVPFTMFMLQKKGLWKGALTAVAIGTTHCVLECIKVLPLQIIVAVCMTAYRSMAFSVINTFIVKVFGLRNVGKHAGTLRGLAGLIVLTQIPLMSYIEHQLHDNFLYEHIGACFLMALLLVMCLWLRKASDQEIIFKGQ